jgi:tripartite-type tricarboxylate transporter receptor subunit TctC
MAVGAWEEYSLSAFGDRRRQPRMPVPNRNGSPGAKWSRGEQTVVGQMKLLRWEFLQIAAGAAALPAISRLARAQVYPTQPVRVIVPFPPAGGTDILARLMGQWLSERFGRQFVIENRSGASTNLGTEVVVRAPPDGYTLLVVDTSPAINATFYDNLNFKFTRDIAVAGLIRQPLVMQVNPSFSARTVPEFIAYAKANPGRINMASAGNGNVSHVAGELFKVMTGVEMVHVPYRGTGPAVTDLLGGQVQVFFGSMAASIEYIKVGRLRALAISTATRSEALPDVPTVGDFVPGYEASVWYGVGAPKNTPNNIIEKLNKEIDAVLTDPKMEARLADLGGTTLTGSPSDFGILIANETEKWAKVVKFAGLKAD